MKSLEPNSTLHIRPYEGPISVPALRRSSGDDDFHNNDKSSSQIPHPLRNLQKHKILQQHQKQIDTPEFIVTIVTAPPRAATLSHLYSSQSPAAAVIIKRNPPC